MPCDGFSPRITEVSCPQRTQDVQWVRWMESEELTEMGPCCRVVSIGALTRDRTDVGKTLEFKADARERSLETALLAKGDFY